MESGTHHPPLPVASALRRGRRLTVDAPPSLPTTLLLSALAAVTLAVAGAWYVIAELRVALAAVPLTGGLVALATVLLALASVIVALPLIRSFTLWRECRRALRREDLLAARSAQAAASDQSWIAIGYAIAQLIIVLGSQFLLANQEAVAKTFFFVPLMLGTFPLVLKAFWLNVQIFVIAEILVLVWGLLLAVAMLAPGAAGKPLRVIATAYVEMFRAIPAVLVIFLVGFGIPLTGVPVIKNLSLQTYAVIALTLTVGAYVAEIYRAGIQSVHWGQAMAARSLGLSHLQSLRFVILPQAVRHIVPPLLNAFIALQKDTALVTVVGVLDSFNQAMVIAANHYNLSAVTTVAVLFIIISIPQSRLVERMMRRDRARIRAGSL